MSEGAHWYFAYGSNMQSQTLRGRRRIEPIDARVGLLRGHRLCFDIPVGPGRRGVANLLAHDEADTWGVLYLLTPDHHEHLDRTEGVPSGLYRRMAVTVVSGDAGIRAETYISDRRDPSRLPSHRYRSLLVEGAREHALPHDYVSLLESWELAWDEREGAVNPPGLRGR